VPVWAWVAAVAAALPLVVGLIVTIPRLPVPPSFSSTATSPTETSTPSSSTAAPREYWGVPLPYRDTVNAVRRQLAIGRDYDGLRWCGEHIERDLTMWTWGDKDDMLTVLVDGAVRSGTEVHVTREPFPPGC
jgi:hypothetical protein